jgi:hypothetical protein
MRVFNTAEAAKFTGIPAEILHRMRTDSTRGYDKRGPPYCRIMNKDEKYDCLDEMNYVYREKDLIEWMKSKNCNITANDAAFILGISRTQVLNFFGIKTYKTPIGEVLICRAKNFFMFTSKKQAKMKLKHMKERKKKL